MHTEQHLTLKPWHSSEAETTSASPELTGGLRWYVVHTQPHAEDRAILNLARQDFRTFCPRVRRTIRHARTRRVVFTPLFPGYLFLALDGERWGWRQVNGTRGVIRILTHNDLPQAMPCGVVEALVARVDADGAINWRPDLEIGGKVRLTEGPFAEFVGTLERLDAAGRVQVLLELMGRVVCVATTAQQLAPA